MPLTNSQYEAIIREYDRRQSENHYRLVFRKEEVYKKCPEIEQIDESIASLSLIQAEKLLNGDEMALQSLKADIEKLTLRKSELLTSLGYGADYLQPQYVCKDCRDTGYIKRQKCHCFTQAAIDMIYTQSNIKSVLEEENFAHFNFDLYSDKEVDPLTGMTPLENVKNAVKICKDFIENSDITGGNLFLYGGTGVGKTFLSNCVAKELLDRNHSVIYFSATQLFDVFKKNAYEKSPEVADDYQNIFDCEVLIIDDLGTEVPNTYTNSQLFMCINERVLRKKSTIISTNLSLNELAETYSERTFSRISKNYTLIKLFGEDLRLI